MLVSELIAQLQQQDPNARVVVSYEIRNNDEMVYVDVNAVLNSKVDYDIPTKISFVEITFDDVELNDNANNIVQELFHDIMELEDQLTDLCDELDITYLSSSQEWESDTEQDYVAISFEFMEDVETFIQRVRSTITIDVEFDELGDQSGYVVNVYLPTHKK